MSDDPSNDDATHSADKPESQVPGPSQQPPVPGMRPITLKPPVAPPVRPAAPEGAAPTGPRPDAAASSGPSTIRLKPVARPATPGGAAGPALAPMTPTAADAARPASVGPPTADAEPDSAPTVRMRPMTAAGDAASAPRPGASPLPPGPKPLKPEQVRAAKAKTSRISLDAALIGGQDDRAGPKTIRLKRPSDAPVGKITSHLGPAAAAEASQTSAIRAQGGRVTSSLIPPIPTEPSKPVVNRFTTSIEMPDSDQDGSGGTTHRGDGADDAEGSSITRRKTIRVKRPGASSAFKVSPKATAKEANDTADLSTDDEDEGGQGVVRMALPAERMHWLFPVLAIASLFVLIASVVVMVAPDRTIADSTAWPSDSPTLRLPGMAPIQGRQ